MFGTQRYNPDLGSVETKRVVFHVCSLIWVTRPIIGGDQIFNFDCVIV